MTAALSIGDATRLRELRRMKLVATGFLVAATLVFIAFRIVGDEGWRGYGETAAEAAMVGGLADWFAVTALFRYPLGLRIPHTAIIPNRKDQIGASLGTFVEDNFLDGDVLAERVSGMHVGDRLARWLGEEDNARLVAGRLADGLLAITEVLDDAAVQDLLQSFVRHRLGRTSAAPVLARALDAAVESGQHQAALDAVLRSLERTIADNDAVFRRKIHEESPWWVPVAIDDRVFAKIVSGVRSFIDDVLSDPDHEIRAHLGVRMADLADRLRTDAALQRRVDDVRDELLDRPELHAWLEQVWTDLEADLRAAVDNPESALHRRLVGGVNDVAGRLRDDSDLRSRIDGYAGRMARYAAESSGTEVSDLITSTVAKWDADDTSRRIELQVGRDLQYIRINGTVVGALAGVAIHAVAQLVG
jgi:uncharacterized membrane-anchored protein YjiN (DUF445 family)